MKVISSLTCLLLALFLFMQTNAQSIQKKYEKAYYLYDKKEYTQAVEICSDLLTETKKIKDASDLWTLHNAAVILYYIYSDNNFELSNKELSKDYLDLAKEYLDLFVSKDSRFKDKVQPRYDSIAVWLSRYGDKSQKSESSEKKEVQPSSQLSNDDVEVVVSGEGPTKEKALQNAIRQAIEQAFGSFISSNTKVINDSLVLDEMSSISNGNIKKYSILNESKLSTNSFVVTLKALLSIKAFTNYCTSKGYKVEFDGGMFALNIQKQILNETSEVNAMKNLVLYTEPLFKIAFDYKIDVNPPTSKSGDNKEWIITYYAKVAGNQNLTKVFDFVDYYLKSVSMPSDAVQEYNALKKTIYKFTFDNRDYYFRNVKSLRLLEFIYFQMYSSVNNYKIKFATVDHTDSLSFLDVYRKSQLSLELDYDLQYILSHDMGFGYESYMHMGYYSFINLLKDFHGLYLTSEFKKYSAGNELLNIKSETDVLSLDQLKNIKEVLISNENIK